MLNSNAKDLIIIENAADIIKREILHKSTFIEYTLKSLCKLNTNYTYIDAILAYWSKNTINRKYVKIKINIDTIDLDYYSILLQIYKKNSNNENENVFFNARNTPITRFRQHNNNTNINPRPRQRRRV